MTLFSLSYANLAPFLTRLRILGELHGPVRGNDGAVRLKPLPPGQLPDLAAQRSLLPPKKYLLAPSETILSYHPATGYLTPPQPDTPQILLGLHPCDLAAIAYLDRLFLAEPPDPLYSARRERLTLIGSSCTPDQHCSCQQTSSPLPASCDLFLYQRDNDLLVSVESARGELLYESVQDLLQPTSPQQPPASTRDHFGSAAATTADDELNPNLPDWQQLADHCLGCGACSICCPTCSCFELLEFGGLDGCSAERLRRWDNCLFKSHAEVAGGHSFQKDRAQRFRYRYRHKYRGYGQLRGLPSCVGCGRCRVQCPTGIDLRPLAQRLERSTP